MYLDIFFPPCSHTGKLETGRKKKLSAPFPPRKSRSMGIHQRLCVPNRLLDKLKNSTPILASFKENSLKRTLHECLDKATDALEDFDFNLQPQRKRPAIVRHAPAALTIYVRKEEDRIFDAVRLNSCSLEGLKEAIAEKYGSPSNMINSVLLKQQKEGMIIPAVSPGNVKAVVRCCLESFLMKDEMVQTFQEEDSFIIDLHFDNQGGNFDVTLRSTEV